MNETTEVDKLKDQLSIARKEIQNLRKQVNSLTHVQQKDVHNIREILENFKCNNCKVKDSSNVKVTAAADDKQNPFRPIGTIRTSFPEKRAVPRQPTIGSKLSGCIEISQSTFTNPEHSLEGLENFSHIWILYHFHKNDSHVKSKVAPPRLGGERVGVFSTRSPHRPCPIGLSLVEIDRIDGSLIYFFGTDMVDGTPVLDVKPYIPIYDSPASDFSNNSTANSNDKQEIFFNEFSREEPDGEETTNITAKNSAANTASASTSSICIQSPIVKVPDWIMAQSKLRVEFNERAEAQIVQYDLNKKSIVDVLEADPRSVYLRTKYGSQIFMFQLGEMTVTCKFDDLNAMVTVLQIRKSESLQRSEET